MHTLRTLEELQLKTSDLVDILPKRISAFVETAAREVRVGRQLLRMNTTILGKPGRSVHLPLRGTIEVDRISEATTPTERKVAWSTEEVTPFKLGTYLYITQESVDGAEIDVVNGSITEAGEALADREDDEIFHEVLGRQPDPTESSGIWTWNEETDNFTGDGTTTVFTLSESPVIEMSTVTDAGSPTTAYSVDYYDGKIEFDVAPVSGNALVIKYWYSERSNVYDANTVADFKLADITAKYAVFRANKTLGDVMVVNPNQYAKLVATDQFVDASKYGAREALLNFEVGKVAGFKVLVTTKVPDGTVLYMNTKRAGWFVNKRNTDVKRKDNPETDAYKFYIYQEFAPKVTEENSVVLSVNHNVEFAKNIT